MDLYDIIAYIVLMAFLVPPIVFIFFGLGKYKWINALSFVGFIGILCGATLLVDRFPGLQWIMAVPVLCAVVLLFVCIGCVCYRINNPISTKESSAKKNNTPKKGELFKIPRDMVSSRIFVVIAALFIVNNVLKSVSLFDFSQKLCLGNVLAVALFGFSAVLAVLTVLNARKKLKRTDVYGVLYVASAILLCIAYFFTDSPRAFKGLSIGEIIIDVLIGCTYILAYFYKADENTKQK